MKLLEYQAKQLQVTWEAKDVPGCRGDARQINHLFTNLLDNALKYLDPARPGVIEITGEKRTDEVVYCIKDNGIGIALEARDKIFEPFQRLDSHNGQGEGMGLSIVRRIVERHHGRLWVESEPDQGSAFYVALPR
jgi:signal transduction histidine kinase